MHNKGRRGTPRGAGISGPGRIGSGSGGARKTQCDSHRRRFAASLCNYAANLDLPAKWIREWSASPRTRLTRAPPTKLQAQEARGSASHSVAMNEPGRAPVPRREISDFSIERILAKDGPSSSSTTTSGRHDDFARVPGQTCASFVYQSTSTTSFVVQNKLDWLRNIYSLPASKPEFKVEQATMNDVHVNSSENVQQRELDTNNTRFIGEELSWLRCTRYRPPKLPKKSSTGKNLKRKPGSYPRIPFTKYQIEILEEKYKSGAYLSRKDVLHLSDLLNLPQTRIKIWFQNRRARERRESQTLDQTPSSTL